MNVKTIVEFDSVDGDESVTRLANTRARGIKRVQPALSGCRVAIDLQRCRKGMPEGFRVRLYVNLAPVSSIRRACPRYLEIHTRHGVMMAAVESAFDKAEELLLPRPNSVPEQVA